MTPKELFTKLKNVKIGSGICQYSLAKCKELIPIINEINELKKEKNAVILAHSYVSPEIIAGVADYTGDSYELSKKAMEIEQETIVFSAVKFMAETAKILNPNKTVLVPSEINGCTLADSITAADVRNLRQKYPDYSFVCYINTTAEVKAECDCVVTSSNVVKVIKNMPNKNIYFLPDYLMAQNVINELKEQKVDKHLKFWLGSCYVHEEYQPELIDYLKLQYSDLIVAVHPECNPEVVKKADFMGSTSQIMKFVQENSGKQFFLVTECGLSSRLSLDFKDKIFVGACTLCRYMKSNTLENILRVLKFPAQENITALNEDTRKKALKSLENMFKYG
ncbi:MAG: quinolinate synthase NadA [Candidatus Margulisiibacteriota bacterium]|jgi:quinolinate synthase